MKDVDGNRPAITIYATVNKGSTPDVYIYQGDLEMSNEGPDLKELAGDQCAKVTVSREYSDKNYGSGGSVFVSVTLTCDQSQPYVDSAIQWAGYYASKHADIQLDLMKKSSPL